MYVKAAKCYITYYLLSSSPKSMMVQIQQTHVHGKDYQWLWVGGGGEQGKLAIVDK